MKKRWQWTAEKSWQWINVAPKWGKNYTCLCRFTDLWKQNKPEINTFLDFWKCRLLNLTTYFGKNFKKNCSDGQYWQLFFKYFPTHTLVFEKNWTDDVIWGWLLTYDLLWKFNRHQIKIWGKHVEMR
jgi:hypothetical protein